MFCLEGERLVSSKVCIKVLMAEEKVSVSLESLKLVKLIHGNVFLASCGTDSVAVKVIRLFEGFSPEHAHEEVSMAKLASEFYPHMPKFLGSFECTSVVLEAHPLEELTTFKQEGKVTTSGGSYEPKPVVLLVNEYLKPLREYLKTVLREHESKVQVSALRQLWCLLQVAWERRKFVHGDLHLDNVMVRECKESILTFQVEGKEVKVQSYGVCVVPIDFGDSFVETNPKENSKLAESLASYWFHSLCFRNNGKRNNSLDVFWGCHGPYHCSEGDVEGFLIPLGPLSLESYLKGPQEYLLNLFRKEEVVKVL